MPREESQLSHDQNFFQLASILCAPLALSAPLAFPIAGFQLVSQFGMGTTICSIFIGNLILWLIGITIISMAEKSRINAIENVSSYIGHYGKIAAAFILILAFLNWYVLEIDSAMVALDSLFHPHLTSNLVKVGAILGFASAFLAIGGIRLLKISALLSMPVMLLYHLYLVLSSDSSLFLKNEWGISFAGIVLTIVILLPGMINLPTVFRHSRSKADSFLALTFITLLTTFFEISTIWVKFSNGPLVGFTALTSFLIVWTLINGNLLNIYFASACWEAFIPRLAGPKGCAIIGLLGTFAYIFMRNESPALFFGNLTNSYLASLGTVLLIAFLVRTIVHHRPRPLEKTINGASWLFGSIVATLLGASSSEQRLDSLLAGVSASLVFFLVVIFIEEVVWSIKKIRTRNRLKEGG